METLSIRIVSMWLKSQIIRLNDERGAETIEWIAMVAVLLILFTSVWSIFEDKGSSLGEQIIITISHWIQKFI